MKLQQLFAEFGWWLRNAQTFSPPVFKRTLGSIEPVIQQLDAAGRQRLSELQQKYDLSRWPQFCNIINFRESLYVLDLLDRYAPSPNQTFRGLDIGSKNWSYLPGLASWSGGHWDGVELDAHRRYWDFTTRRAHGDYMARAFPDCHYHAGSLLEMQGQYTLITWLLPFITLTPHLRWGLPQRLFQPEELLQHVWQLLQPGGTMLILNQGEAEAEQQARLYQRVGISAQSLGQLESRVSPYQKPRYCWLLHKTQ